MVLIAARYALDEEWGHWIAHNFDQVQVYAAPEQQFKQIVLFGVRAKSETLKTMGAVKKQLTAIGKSEAAIEELPVLGAKGTYQVPAIAEKTLEFFRQALEPEQLAEETRRYPGLWPQFEQRFHQQGRLPKQPLSLLSSWHLALCLAAGQVSGCVSAQDGRTFILKGDTFKATQETRRFEETSSGGTVEVIEQRDKFVPVIPAIDMTENSPSYGQALTIK